MGAGTASGCNFNREVREGLAEQLTFGQSLQEVGKEALNIHVQGDPEQRAARPVSVSKAA